jgi:hypothetical protein
MPLATHVVHRSGHTKQETRTYRVGAEHGQREGGEPQAVPKTTTRRRTKTRRTRSGPRRSRRRIPVELFLHYLLLGMHQNFNNCS